MGKFRAYVLAFTPKEWHAAINQLFDAGINPVLIAQWIVTYRDTLASIVQKLIDAANSLPTPPAAAHKDDCCDPDLAARLHCMQCNLACQILDLFYVCDKVGCPCPDDDCDPA